MGCTHPFGYIQIRDETGELVGLRCPACRRVAYKGDTFWTSVREAFRCLLGRAPRD